MRGALRGIIEIRRLLEEARRERQVLAEALELSLRLEYPGVNAIRERLIAVRDGTIHETEEGVGGT